jgi:hypothetical protein
MYVGVYVPRNTGSSHRLSRCATVGRIQPLLIATAVGEWRKATGTGRSPSCCFARRRRHREEMDGREGDSGSGG